MEGRGKRLISFVLLAVAFVALLFKLPSFFLLVNFSDCPWCFTADALIPALGASYFLSLFLLFLLQPLFLSRRVAAAGLLFSLILALVLLLSQPHLCLFCLIGHSAHVLFWLLWVLFPAAVSLQWGVLFVQKVLLAAVAGALSFAFLLGLNSFLEPKVMSRLLTHAVQEKERCPQFVARTTTGKEISFSSFSRYNATLLHFVLCSCPYCKEQLPYVQQLASRWSEKGVRFINIAASEGESSECDCEQEILDLAPEVDLITDPDRYLGKLFGVHLYPTALILDHRGVVVMIIRGADPQMVSQIEKALSALSRSSK